MSERIVITGIGMVTSLGADRESTWRAARAGVSGVRQLEGIAGIPSGRVLAATVDPLSPFQGIYDLPLALRAAAEALADCQLHEAQIDSARIGCSIAANMGNTPGVHGIRTGSIPEEATAWAEQWMPITVCAAVGRQLNLHGPRLCSTSACASGTIATLSAVASDSGQSMRHDAGRRFTIAASTIGSGVPQHARTCP